MIFDIKSLSAPRAKPKRKPAGPRGSGKFIMEMPYIKHLQLGMPVGDFVIRVRDEDNDIYDLVSNDANSDWWADFIKMLVQSKDQNIRFVFEDEGDESTVFAPKLPDLSAIGYSYEDWGAAEEDSIRLNEFIKKFYGTKNKRYKAKVTSKEYVKKNGCCPACGGKATRVDAGIRFENKRKAKCILGCDNCNAQWSEIYVLERFENLRSR